MEIKVCGMRDFENINDVSTLSIDYMGFIFYPPSPRYVGDDFQRPILGNKIKTIGVFVNESMDDLIKKVKRIELDGVQLHGDESPDYCKKIKAVFPDLLLFKAFRIKDKNDLKQIISYEEYCDRFIFDTKGKYFGGNGEIWDHSILLDQKINTHFFISGGIDEHFDKRAVESIHPKCIGLDLNSKFEIEPGFKELNKLKTFIER